MPDVGDKQRCTTVGCRGEMVLRERRPAASSIPHQIGSGQPFPTTDRLRIWMCELDPKHVEVVGWGMRPIKDCSVAGCKGVMVHTTKGRSRLEGDVRRERPGQPYAMLQWEPGWLCLENEKHFESAVKP
jgi:hypothetical protein